MNWIENARRQFLRPWIRLRWRSLRNHALDSFSIPAPAGLAVLDSEFRVIQANKALADMIGVAPKAMAGQGPSSLIPQIAPTFEPILRSVSQTGIPALNFPVSGDAPGEPGVIRHWIASVFSIRQWGFAGCIGVIVMDVTDQIQCGLLVEAERLADIGSWEVNVLTGEETWSPNLRRMLGLGPNHMRQSEEAFWALVHPEDREMVRSIIDWAIKFKHPYEYQTRLLLPNGCERTFFTRGKPVFNSSKCLIKRVGVTQDITERLEMNRAVNESEEKYRDLVENSQDLICTHDLDGRILWMNELPARVLGYSTSDLIGHSIPEMLPPETRNLFSGYIERIRRDGHAEGLMNLVARSGERRIWEYHNTLRTEGVAKPIVRGVAHDVTDRKRAEEALRKQRVVVQGLFETAKTLTRGLELQGVLDVLNFQALTLIGAESAWAGVRTKEGLCCDSFLEGDPFRKLSFSWPPGIAISKWVLQNKQTYLTNDAEHDDLIPPEIREALALRSVLCVPVFDIHQDAVAFFALNNKNGGFGQDDVAMVQGISTVASIAIQNALIYHRVCRNEDELRRLSMQLMTSQDYEHRRIAEELHEHTAQDLAGLILSLGHLRSSVPDLPPPSRTILDESIAIARRVFHETRTLSYKLHDSSLELAGLAVAIPSYARTFGERSGITVRTEIPEDFGRLTPDEETTVYRIVQQALSNVHRHSGSKVAAINVHREGERVLVEIEDSGEGMSREDDRNVNDGVGIASMRERVKRHGGSMDIESTPGKGFKIRFQFSTGSAVTKHAVGGAGHD